VGYRAASQDSHASYSKGEHRFNRTVWKTKEAKPEAEQIGVPVEPIIDAVTFDAVQAMLKAKNPRVTAPRVVTGPILLTGLATCATCSGGMTLRTGKSGRYRYYTCATSAQQGKSGCKGRSVPMDRLDSLVSEKLAEKLLSPERVGKLVSGLMNRQAAKDQDHSVRVTALRSKLTDAEGRLGRLYAAIENGIADPNDATLKGRIEAVKTERDIAAVAFERAVSEMRPDTKITDEKIAAFAGEMRTHVLNGETPFRRAYIRSVIDQVEVDDTEIRIKGRKSVLEKLVMAGGASPAGVPSFVREWRARRDSNS
jgi:hypothetical protein